MPTTSFASRWARGEASPRSSVVSCSKSSTGRSGSWQHTISRAGTTLRGDRRPFTDSASGFTSGEATISLGPARTTSTPGSSFILTSVLAGALDLVAVTTPVVSYPNFDRVATKVLVRRNQNLADGGSLLLDFSGPSAATPTTGRLTVGGLSGGSASVSVDFMTASGAWATTYDMSDGPPVQNYVGVPSRLRRRATFTSSPSVIRIRACIASARLPLARRATATSCSGHRWACPR